MSKKPSGTQDQPVEGTARATPGTQDQAGPEYDSFGYWNYFQPGPTALSMLAPGTQRDRLQALLEDGDADVIAEWLESAEVPEAVKEVLRQGLRGESDYDAVEVGRLDWHDHLGTVTTCVAQRKDENLLYQAWQNGMILGEHLSKSELGGNAIRNLMVTGEIVNDDYFGKTSFEASSDFHDDLEDYDVPDGPEEPDEPGPSPGPGR